MIAALEVGVDGGRVTRLAAEPPLAAKVLAGPLGPELVLVGAAASLLEGDRLSVSIRVGEGASLVVRTAAATLAHPCPGAGTTSYDVDVELAAGARLAWLPEPLVACAGCRHTGRSRLRLAEGAVAVWADSLALGRTGEQPGQVELRLDADLAGKPLLRDGLRAGPQAPGWDGPAVLDRARHVGTLAILGEDAAIDGGMALAGPGTLVRVMGAAAAGVAAALAPSRRALLAALVSKGQIPTRSAEGSRQPMVM